MNLGSTYGYKTSVHYGEEQIAAVWARRDERRSEHDHCEVPEPIAASADGIGLRAGLERVNLSRVCVVLVVNRSQTRALLYTYIAKEVEARLLRRMQCR